MKSVLFYNKKNGFTFSIDFPNKGVILQKIEKYMDFFGMSTDDFTFIVKNEKLQGDKDDNRTNWEFDKASENLQSPLSNNR